MKFNAIMAVAQNGVIGNQGKLPWPRIDADMKKFRDLTMGHPVIMGSSTLFGMGRELPGRPNIVMTRNPEKLENYVQEKGFRNTFVVSSIDQLKHLLEEMKHKWGEESWFIGGAEIYNLALRHNLIDQFYVTRIYQDFEGDVSFDIVDMKDSDGEQIWELVTSENLPENVPPLSFEIYNKLK